MAFLRRALVALAILALALPVVWATEDEEVCTPPANLLFNIDGDACTDLIAGQHTTVGTVCLSVSGNFLVATYSTIDDWVLTEYHLWVGTSIDDAPRTSTGNPRIGRFTSTGPVLPPSSTVAVSTSFCEVAEFAEPEDLCDTVLVIAAHAVVRNNVTGRTETAWGYGPLRFNPQGSWATYFTADLTCPVPTPTPTNGACTSKVETAVVFGPTTFIQLGITSSRWGWVNQFTTNADATIVQPLYAAAGGNNLLSGFLAGTATISFVNGNKVQVSLASIDGEPRFQTVHVYVGRTAPTTIAFGQWGNTYSYNPLVASFGVEEFTLPGGEGAYVAVHVDTEICGLPQFRG